MHPTMTFAAGIAVKSAVVLAAALLLCRVLRRQPASLRHTVWTAAFASLLLIPILAVLLPPIRVVPIWPAGGVSGGVAAAPAIDARVVTPARAAAEAPAASARPGRAGGAVAPRVASPAKGRPPAAVAAAPVEPRRGSLAGFFATIWLAGAGACLARVMVGEAGIRRIGRAGHPVTSPEWRGLVEELRKGGELSRGARVLEIDRLTVPLTYGLLRPVVLLPRAGRRWSEAHRRDVLTHELAHIRRHDCLTHELGRLACALHWFNPLAWIGLREARLEREHACDDAVLRTGSLASGYADALLTTARETRLPAGLATAGLALARRSNLSDRLLAVLDPDRPRRRLRPATLGTVFGAGLALTLPLAALAPLPPDPPDGLSFRAPESIVAGTAAAPITTGVVVTFDPAAAAPVQLGAVLAAAPLDRPAIGVAPVALAGATLDPAPVAPVQQAGAICPVARDGRARKVRLTSTMSITGQGTASDGENQFVAWTGVDCSVVIHATGTPVINQAETDIASLPRGARFRVTHTNGEVERVYEVRARGGSLDRTFTIDGRTAEMDAGFERWRSTLILAFIRRSGYDAEARVVRILDRRGVDGVLDEIGAIESDYVGGRYFRGLLGSGRVAAGTAPRIIALAGTRLESDYELGRVLAALPASLLASEPARRAFVTAVGTMESDYEKRKAVDAILAGGSLGPELAGVILGVAQSIESDYELATLLIGLATRGDVRGPLDAPYLAAVRTIESDYEKHRVLSALLAGGQSHEPLIYVDGARIDTPGPARTATIRSALEAGAGIESDYELASWLVEVASLGPLADELRPPFFAAAGSLESSHERSRVLRTALAPDQVSAGLVSDVIAAAAGIGSDFELGRILRSIAERGLVTDQNRPAFRRTLEQMSSGYERDRVLAALGERRVRR